MRELRDNYTRIQLNSKKKEIKVEDKWRSSLWKFPSLKLATQVFDGIEQKHPNKIYEIPLFETAYNVCRKICGPEELSP